MKRFTLAWLAPLILAPFTTPAHAAIIPVRDMELAGQATVTASTWDIGHKDNLFDQNWTNIYRTASVNPAVITVEFVTSHSVAAARGLFTHATRHEWTLEAADSLSDLNTQSGSYVSVFGPTEVTGDGVQWAEWNQSPVTRRIFRFTVERTVGDDYVHIHELELQSPEPEVQIPWGAGTVRINIIEIDPDVYELPLGSSLQYTAEASLCYGPDRYDVTSLADWSSDDDDIATITSGGMVTAVGTGATTINADITPVHAESDLTTRYVRPPDLNVGFIHRTPEYNRFKVSFSGDQHIQSGYENEQKWPAPGETVTYTAHVFNKGDQAANNIAYRWYFDDQLIDSGTISSLAGGTSTTLAVSEPWPADTVQTVSIPEGAQDLHPKQLERAIGDHTIRIEVDPFDTIAETCEINNVVEDYINALTFWIFMDETTYAYFHNHDNFYGSMSAEDWARGQLIGFERRLRVSGTPQKLRLDMLAVYPDGELNAGGTHEPIGSETRQADGRWGFQIGEWPESKVVKYAKIVENPLCHEWGHQIGLIDVYAYDIATGNCLITYGGSPVAGTPFMPLVSPWNVYYGNMAVQHAYGSANEDWTGRALMADTGRRYIGAGSAAGLNRNLGMRRGFYGDYLGAVQQGDIKLHVRHYNGTPVANCGIRVFQRALNGQVPDTAKFTGTTNAQGRWTFPNVTEIGWEGGLIVNNPWSYIDNSIVYDCPNAVGANAPLVVELTYDDEVEYHFIEVDACNIAMANGQVDNYTFELVTYQSRAGNHLPTINTNCNDTIYLTEGQPFETTVTTNDADSDPVTLSATPLYNSTFDPDTGRFTFRPDSLQVNRYYGHTESMYVDFVADDGKFVTTTRVNFRVSDDPNLAYLDEIDSDGDHAGDIADPDDDNDGVDDGDDLCPGTAPGTAVDLDGCPLIDIDSDGDTDFTDIDLFLGCMNGPDNGNGGCDPAHFTQCDFDGDNDVDTDDLNWFQILLHLN